MSSVSNNSVMEHASHFESKVMALPATKNSRVITREDLATVTMYLQALRDGSQFKITPTMERRVNRNKFQLVSYPNVQDVVSRLMKEVPVRHSING